MSDIELRVNLAVCIIALNDIRHVVEQDVNNKTNALILKIAESALGAVGASEAAEAAGDECEG